MRDELDDRLAGLGRVSPEAASRVASRARRRVVDGVRAHEPERARTRPKARRLGRVLRISLATCAVAAIVGAVWSASVGSERSATAHAAARPFSSYSHFDQALLRRNGMLGTAVLTRAGRTDALGHVLYVSRSRTGSTCVILMDSATQPGGVRCLPRALGTPQRPGEVFVTVSAHAAPHSGRLEIEGVAGPSVRRIRLVYANGTRRDWTPRDGVFGVAVAAPRSVQLLGAGGEVLLRRAVPASLGAG